MSEATKQLLQAGILGPVLVLMSYYIWQLTKQTHAIQEKRVAENAEALKTVARMSDRWSAALMANTRALEANRKAFEDLKHTIQSLSEDE